MLNDLEGSASSALALRFDASLRILASETIPSVDAKPGSGVVKNFLTHVSQYFLSVLLEASGGKVRSCAELMYKRAVCCGNVLGQELMLRALDVLKAYLRLGMQQPSELREMAILFAGYINTHMVDPDNALIGLKLSTRALKELLGANAVDELLAKRDAEEKLSRQVQVLHCACARVPVAMCCAPLIAQSS
jgi:hypothetical protein